MRLESAELLTLQFMKDKDHPTLKSLWKDLNAAMKWAKIKSAKLAEISATRIQFRFIS